jgi:hypothetical protein
VPTHFSEHLFFVYANGPIESDYSKFSESHTFGGDIWQISAVRVRYIHCRQFADAQCRQLV